MIWRCLCTTNCLNIRYNQNLHLILQLRGLFISFKEKLAVLVQLSSQTVDRFTTDKSSGRPVHLKARKSIFLTKRSTGSQAVDQFNLTWSKRSTGSLGKNQAVDRFSSKGNLSSKRSTGSLGNPSGRPVHAETLFWQIIFSEFLEPIDYDLNL